MLAEYELHVGRLYETVVIIILLCAMSTVIHRRALGLF